MSSPLRTSVCRPSLLIIRSAMAAMILLLPLLGPATPVLAAEDPPVFMAKWGTSGTGDGQFLLPFDVAVHTDGSIYVVDSNNNRVQKFNSAYEYVLQWGTYGTGNSQFDLPYAIAVDSVGDVYVLDSCNHRVQKFESDGTYITQWGSLYYPYGITIDDDGYVYVADTGHQCVQKFQSDGTYVTQWGSPGSGDGQFNNPEGIDVDNNGYVYVVDSGNHRIQKFESDGTYVTQWGSYGTTGDGYLNWPIGLAVDADGDVYVSDSSNNRMQKFDSNGTFLTKWGALGTGDGEFDMPSGVDVDTGGNIYVADRVNRRIQVFAPGPWHTFLGSVNNDEACGIAADNDGNVYVSGTTNSDWIEGNPKRGYSGECDTFVTKLSPTGTITWYTFLGQAYNDYGRGIAIDGDGDVYVTGYSDDTWGDSPRREHLGSWDAFVAKLDGRDGTLLWNSFLGAGTYNDMGFDITVDEAENVYVTGISWSDWAETDATRDPSGGADAFIAKLDANGDLDWYGFLGGSGDECSNYAGGVAVDGAGYVYVTSSSASSWSEGAVDEHHGGADAFVARLAPDGALTWHTFMGSSWDDSGTDVAVDESGNAYVTGTSALSWGTDPRLDYGGGTSDAFVASLGADGSLTWHTFLGGSGDEAGNGIALDVAGNIYVGGSGWGTWGNPEVDYAGYCDMFAAKLSPNGSLTWHTFAGSAGYEWGLAIDVAADGLVLVAGSGDATWGDPVREYSHYNDGLVVQLVIPTSTVVDVDLDLEAGWNLISVPLILADATAESVFPGALVYTWDADNDVYEQVHSSGTFTEIEPGRAYWVAMAAPDTITVTGTPVASDTWTVHLYEGWNMIGGPYSATAISKSDLYDGGAGALRSEHMYWWDPSGEYADEDELEQGKGYWIAATGECDLVIQASS